MCRVAAFLPVTHCTTTFLFEMLLNFFSNLVCVCLDIRLERIESAKVLRTKPQLDQTNYEFASEFQYLNGFMRESTFTMLR